MALSERKLTIYLMPLLLGVALVLLGCGADQPDQPRGMADSGSGGSDQQSDQSQLSRPIVTAWMYLADDQDYAQIPKSWSSINFRTADVLNVGPAGVQRDGTFGFYESRKTGDLANRFEWVLRNARAQNPDIKIIVSQWWGYGDDIWGQPLSALRSDKHVKKYTKSVGGFLAEYLDKSGGVDGYDIDYEDNNISARTEDITSQIRTEFDALSQDQQGRRFYQTVSPSTTGYLGDAVDHVDYVNMQTYDGGMGLIPRFFLSLGFTSDQLLYGICPETDCPTPSIEEAEAAYKENDLAGIHVYRLNSGNQQEEGEVQNRVYELLHGS